MGLEIQNTDFDDNYFHHSEYVAPAERVKAGAAWLDEEKPDWFESVGQPSVRNCGKCVLCQVFKKSHFRWARHSAGLSSRNAALMGFDVMTGMNEDGTDLIEDIDEAYSMLENLWAAEIEQRKILNKALNNDLTEVMKNG